MTGVPSSEPTEVSDRDLVAQAQGGAMPAFDALVRRHQGRAFNVAFQLLRNHEDAAEVAQDAFVRIYRNIGTFRGECEFTTWLHQIVVNLARNKHRWWHRRGREHAVALDDVLANQLPAAESAPDAEADRLEFARRLSAKMAELPAISREVLVLRNVEQMSYEEIAVALECSVGTVKSRIARAREALRELMETET
jgi:RNA polymerase sigma-70 factor (ECF subfamily)